MRVGALVCYGIAIVLAVIGVIRLINNEDGANGSSGYGLITFVPAVLMVVLGLWLFRQPKADDKDGP